MDFFIRLMFCVCIFCCALSMVFFTGLLIFKVFGGV